MITVELEERVKRRDYKLPAVFGCYICFNNQDRNFDFVNIVVDKGVNQKCMENHVTNIHRKCSRCNTNYPLYVDICPPCEERITEIILREKLIVECDENLDEARRQLRKKQIDEAQYKIDVKALTTRKDVLTNELKELNEAKV